MRDWRRAPAVALVVMGLYLGIQLFLPISRLDEVSAGERFGWQMFSSYQPQPEFTVHTETGSSEVDLADITARIRADLDLEAVVPPFLCDSVLGAVSVSWADQEHRC